MVTTMVFHIVEYARQQPPLLDACSIPDMDIFKKLVMSIKHRYLTLTLPILLQINATWCQRLYGNLVR